MLIKYFLSLNKFIVKKLHKKSFDYKTEANSNLHFETLLQESFPFQHFVFLITPTNGIQYLKIIGCLNKCLRIIAVF